MYRKDTKQDKSKKSSEVFSIMEGIYSRAQYMEEGRFRKHKGSSS